MGFSLILIHTASNTNLSIVKSGFNAQKKFQHLVKFYGSLNNTMLILRLLTPWLLHILIAHTCHKYLKHHYILNVQSEISYAAHENPTYWPHKGHPLPNILLHPLSVLYLITYFVIFVSYYIHCQHLNVATWGSFVVVQVIESIIDWTA